MASAVMVGSPMTDEGGSVEVDGPRVRLAYNLLTCSCADMAVSWARDNTLQATAVLPRSTRDRAGRT